MPRIIEGTDQNIIGKNLKRLRLERKMKQKQVSEQLEMKAVYVCRGSISRIENGTRTVTDIEIDAIAKILQVSLDELFGREASEC